MYFDLNELISEHIAQATPKKLQMFATVTDLGPEGTVLLRFDGEEKPSKKQYQRLSGYSPSIGDRVLLMRHNGTVLVVDKVVGVPAPFPKPKPDPPTTEEILIKESGEFIRFPITITKENLVVNVGKENAEAVAMQLPDSSLSEVFNPVKISEKLKIKVADAVESIDASLGI